MSEVTWWHCCHEGLGFVPQILSVWGLHVLLSLFVFPPGACFFHLKTCMWWIVLSLSRSGPKPGQIGMVASGHINNENCSTLWWLVAKIKFKWWWFIHACTMTVNCCELQLVLVILYSNNPDVLIGWVDILKEVILYEQMIVKHANFVCKFCLLTNDWSGDFLTDMRLKSSHLEENVSH